MKYDLIYYLSLNRSRNFIYGSGFKKFRPLAAPAPAPVPQHWKKEIRKKKDPDNTIVGWYAWVHMK
jgi:hypothetical protein